MPIVATGDPPAPSAWPASAGYVPRRAIKARPLGWFWQRALAFGALALALPIALVTARGTVDWPGRPFPGFFAMGNGIVPTVGLYSWTGLGSGIPFHARVVAADDTPVRTNADLYRHVADLPVGTPVRYTLTKQGETFTRTAPTMRFGLRDYWLTVGLLAAFGFLSIGTGVAVALLQPRKPAAKAFLIQGVCTGLFALTGTALYHPDLQWLSRLHFVTQATFPATFIHLGLVFPIERRLVIRRPAWIAAPYGVAAALSAWVLVGFYASQPETTPLYASYLYAALSIVVLVGLVAFAYWENRTPLVRPQLRSVLPGLLLGTVVGLFAFLDNARSGGHFPVNFIAIPPLLFYLSVGYAITRHHLFDIDVLVRQAALYGTLTLGITAAYAGSVAFLGLLLPEEAVRGSRLFTIVFVVLVASCFEPLRRRVQGVIDRVFFRSRPDYRRTVGEVSAALTPLLDLDRILSRIGRTVADGLQLRSLRLILWDGDRARVWRYRAGEDRMGETEGLPCQALRRVLEESTPNPWRLPEDDESNGGVRQEMAAVEAVLLLPLTVAGRVIGAIALGPRRSGLPFSSLDLELLGTLAAQGAVAIQNALSYRALEELNAQLDARVGARTAALEASNAELDRAYRDLKAAQAQLLQTEKLASLGQLVAGVAHEINNPVSFIVGNIEPLRGNLGMLRALAERHGDAELAGAAEQASRAFELIAHGAERTAGIVQDLRTFSRVGDVLPRPTDTHEGIDVTLRLLKPRWNNRIEIHRDYGALPAVSAAPGQLNQVFMNLLANACDAIEGRGNIWIHTAHDGNRITVTIRDDGCGIAPEHLDRIFDPFFTTKPQGYGTGLGLAISYGIVTQHGGTLQVSSHLGRGTEFAIALPIRPPIAG